MASPIFVHEGELIHQASIYDKDDFLLSLLTDRGNGNANSKDNLGRSPVHTAAQHGSEKCLKVLLDYGGNPNLVSSAQDHCSTPVHHAAVNGHLPCIKLLVERGADLDIPNAHGKTPAELAVLEAHLTCVQYLRHETGRRRMEQEALLQEALFTETANGKFHRVQEIIEKLGDKFNIDKQYNAGETLLMKACEKGSPEIVNLLLEKGASASCNPFTGTSALYAACVNGNTEVVKPLLVKYPALAKQGTKIENNNPLHIVCGNGNIEIAKLILQVDDGSPPYPCIGLDINCPTNSGMTPLHNAATEGHVEIMKILLKPNHCCIPPCTMKMEVDVNARSKVGCTPLHNAVTIGHVDVVEILLENHANPNCVARTDVLSSFEELTEEMADMVEPTTSGTVTPLQLACRQRKIEIMKVLLRHGAKDVGNNCLHRAISSKDEEMTILLLGKDVNPSREYNLPQKLREQRNDLAPVSIVWHNYGLNKLETEWICSAPKAVLKPEVVATLNKLGLAATITNLDISKNLLKSLPIEIFQLPSLKHFTASQNEISFLPTGGGRSSVGSTSSDDVFDEHDSAAAIWYCPHLEEIDLQNNNLTSLPGCLFLLPALKTLNASKNDIGSLPFDIWNSPNLRTVLLSNNYIKGLPMLPNASEVFSVNANGARRLRPSGAIEEERPNPATSGNRNRGEDIKDAKPEVERLKITSFRSLLGYGHPETEDSEEDEDLETQAECPLEKLDLSFNQLVKFPVGLPCLAPKMSKLLLSNNNIEKFPPIQEIPENLSHLDLSFNKLRQCIPSCEEKQCDRLCYSPVHKRRLSKRRSRSRTSISSPVCRIWCRHCRHKRLRHLKRLELSNNILREVRFLCKGYPIHKARSMTNVSKEDETSGGTLGPTGFNADDNSGQMCFFPNLVSLTLNDNKLEYLTEELGKLTKLGSLDVSNNPLTKIPRLPPALGMLGDLWDLNLKGLNLVDPPPSVLEKRTKAITGYLLSVLDKSKPYPNMKLMFVGVSNIGKSTLLGKLRDDGYIPKGWHERKDNMKKASTKSKKTENVSTVGVDVSEWLCPSRPVGYVFKSNRQSIKFSTWDFGGQKEYYATHQLFLTHRALYLAIWKLTDGEEGVRNLHFWLLNIQARAPDSVVIIVGTFYDQLTAHEKKSGFVDRMHTLIYQLYVGKDHDGGIGCPRERGLPKVVRVIDVSCTTGHHINLLRDMIYTTALEIKGPGGHSLLEEKLVPASYLAVEAAVNSITGECYATNQTPVLRADVFRKKVEQELEIHQVKLRGHEELEQACQFLHDNGVLLHYDDPSLCGLYFLDPQWLCDMMAHVVAIRDVNPFVQNGVMRSADLSQLFRSDRFPSNFIREYIDLLNKFEVALPWSSEHLLVPSLLPEQQIGNRNIMAAGMSAMVARAMNMAAYTENRVLRRQYLMSYVPSGFWARLITRMINDKQLKVVVGACMEFVMDGNSVVIEDRERAKIAQPEWSCWKTGLELSCYGVKLLRICELKNTPFYGCPDENQTIQILINGEEHNTSPYTVVEVIAPSVMMEMEKFVVKKGPRHPQPGRPNDSPAKNFVGFRVKSVSDCKLQTAARFLALTIDHIDTLLVDWYPGLDMTNIFGENLVTRLVPCQRCIRRIVSMGTALSPRQQRRKPGEGSQEPGDEENKRTSPSRKSTFYFKTPEDENHEESTRDLVPTQDEPPTREATSPSSDSGSSSGVGTDNSFVTIDRDDSSRESSPVSHNVNRDHLPGLQRNEYEQDTTDSEAERSRTSSQTSGVPPSPRHGSGVGVRVIATFEFEECVVVSHTTDHVICPIDGELLLKEVAPDVVFADIAPELNIEPSSVTRKKKLGRGAFGTVYAGEIKQGGKVAQVALKMPLDYDVDANSTEEEVAEAKAAKRKVQEVPHQIYTEAYRSVRQELSILINLNHPHILLLKGFCLNPLSLVLEFAPMKSLEKILAEYKRAGPRLDPYVLQKCVVQCSAALKYLHKHHIIYRDLKSENILVWKFPNPFSPNQHTHQVVIKVADYGISRSAAIAGAKGLGGTPGFMAPEIEKYSGREAYTDKVDTFSFGMFLYELITLGQPFSDLNAAQVKQLVVEGKRPELSSKDKRAPVFALELMLWCWAQNPEDRPSSTQIYAISSNSEFPRLLDVLTFDEALHLSRSITTRSRDYAGHGADGQLSIGKEVWLFHSKLNNGVQKETVDVLCYSNGRSNHLEEFVVAKHVILCACSVGNTVWLGSDTGLIYVYCAITYKPLCQGTLLSEKYIMSMIHAPKCHCVLVGLYNGHIMAYSDNVYTHNGFRESCDLTSPKDLSPLRTYVGTSYAHCLAVVGIPKDNENRNGEGSSQITYEVWCGKGKGRISVLNADTLEEKQFLAAEDCDIDNPCLENLTVTTLQTCQTYAGSIDEADPLASSVWVAVYPGTSVYRYDARVKRVVNSIDCLQNRPSCEGSHQIYAGDKKRKVTESQVLSLLVVNRELYIGTSSGCFLVCNSLSLLVYSVIRCHKSLECLLPLTTTPVTWNLGTEESSQKEHSRLVLTCGKGYRSICSGRPGTGPSNNIINPSGKRGSSVILVWLADER